ncbi:MAG: hypothetical protein IPK82_43620 [Polyangiaceae bacterium]|nr:hypothetical protein [Polyangiaceae bacterium]
MKTILAGLTLAAAFTISSTASGQPMWARDTASVLPPWKWRGGLMAPVELGIGNGVELSTSLAPWFMLSPNLSVRAELGHIGNASFLGEYGLSFPTPSMYMLQGYLFPSFTNGDGKIGWAMVPLVAISGSLPLTRRENENAPQVAAYRGVLTGKLDAAIGIPFEHTDIKPLETFAPIDLVYAPALNGHRVHLGVMYDHAILNWLRGRVGISGYWVGQSPYPPRSPFTFSADASLEVALGKHVRVALGGVYFNSDQRATALERGDDGRLRRVSVRSNDIYPTFDFILGSAL